MYQNNEKSSSKHWETDHVIVYEDNAIKLLKFSSGDNVPIILVPPQAGHHSYIADYGKEQSLVHSAAQNYSGAVYAIEWKPCTWIRRNEGIEDLLSQLGTAVDFAGKQVSLVGLCQGGWLATIYASLYPSKVSKLIIAGSPIDTHSGKSILHKVTKLPMFMYQHMVVMGFGLMKGDMMLASWKSGNPKTHYIDRYTKPNEQTEHFYKWYDHTQDLAGKWYLWAIKNLFKKNKLGLNKLNIAGNHVDLGELSKLDAVHIVVGKKDDITPPEQSLTLQKYVNSKIHSIDAGHIGVFMGKKGINDIWNPLFSGL